MSMLIKTLATACAAIALSASAFAQSARDVRGATPYLAIENEPGPRLVVDAPLPAQLALGIVQIQYRVENVRIVPVFGTGALDVSPRIGHLHVTVDDLPWHWADASDSNTIDLVGMLPGEHKVLIELVNAAHRAFDGCGQDCRHTSTFTVPGQVSSTPHAH
jgi:hypothetical protein